MSTVIDSCGVENAGSAAQAIGTGVGQSLSGNGSPITSCAFYLYTSGGVTLTGTIYAKLYAHTGTYGTSGKPTGPVLATSKPVSASILTSIESLINFGFVGAQRVTLTSGTKYVITLEHLQDASGNHAWARRTDTDIHSGNGSYKDTNWIPIINGIDFIFYVYTGDPVDIIPPVITLTGSATVNITVGASYSDAGATALDDVDGNITANIVTVNSVNTAIVGTYTVTYNVDDLSGNPAVEVVRTVNILPVVNKSITNKILILMGKGVR